jgi:hypothetical protein
LCQEVGKTLGGKWIKNSKKREIKIPNENKYVFTPTKYSYFKHVERLKVWKKMGEKEES